MQMGPSEPKNLVPGSSELLNLNSRLAHFQDFDRKRRSEIGQRGVSRARARASCVYHDGTDHPSVQGTEPKPKKATTTAQRTSNRSLAAEADPTCDPSWSPTSPLVVQVPWELTGMADPWGYSEGELRLLTEGTHFLAGLGLPLGYVVPGDDLLDMEAAPVRDVVRRLTTRISRDQKRAGLPQFWLRGWEVGGGLHANIVAVATPEMLASWQNSCFAPYLGRDGVQPIYDVQTLAQYLGKERLPNVRGGRAFGPRSKGSFPIEGGGDRLIPSDALKAALIEKGAVRPWKRTYTTGLEKPKKPELVQIAPAPPILYRETLFDLAPVLPPPRIWIGIEAKITSPTRSAILVRRGPLLPIDFPPDAVDRLRDLPGTDAEKAARLRRSRSQVTNLQNRQYGASRELVREILRLQ